MRTFLKNNKLKTVVIINCFLLLTGCATPNTQTTKIRNDLVEIESQKQKERIFKKKLEYQNRLNNISFPLLISSRPWCENKSSPKLGLIFANKYSFGKAFESSAISVLGVSEAPQITSIAQGSPADSSGLEVGDIIVKINEQEVASTKDANKKLNNLLLAELNLESPINIFINRNETLKKVSITPIESCDYQILLGDDTGVEAYTDGRKVVIHRGVMRFTIDDNELSFIVAHELAHNVMGHKYAKIQNIVFGSIYYFFSTAYNVLTGSGFKHIGGVYSKEFELEADYVALYILARANKQIEQVAEFWRRLAVENPNNLKNKNFFSHPATPERYVATMNTIAEINYKKKSGLPLLPKMKD